MSIGRKKLKLSRTSPRVLVPSFGRNWFRSDITPSWSPKKVGRGALITRFFLIATHIHSTLIRLVTSHTSHDLTASTSRLTFTSTWYLTHTVQIPHILIFTLIRLVTSHTSHDLIIFNASTIFGRSTHIIFNSCLEVTNTLEHLRRQLSL